MVGDVDRDRQRIGEDEVAAFAPHHADGDSVNGARPAPLAAVETHPEQLVLRGGGAAHLAALHVDEHVLAVHARISTLLGPGISAVTADDRKSWWTGLDSNQRRGNPGRFTVCCL